MIFTFAVAKYTTLSRYHIFFVEFLGEKQSFLTPEPVRLTPAWEAGNLPNDELNLKGITMEEAQLECSQPKDR